MALTTRQQRFVEAFDGNGTEAARLAGYKGSDAVLANQAYANMRNPEIREAIRAREVSTLTTVVATRAERQAFWTRTLQNPVLPLAHRLRASELLGKSQADFTLNVKHSGDVRVLVVDPYAVQPEDEPKEG